MAVDTCYIEEWMHEVTLICQTAGDIIMQFYLRRKDLKIDLKKDHSPVTTADIEAHYYLEKALQNLQAFPVLSEESQSFPIIKDANDPYWLVDPIDGTKEFISATDEFTVNVALIINQMPILGVICAPALGLSYFASQESGAFKKDAYGHVEAISVRPFVERSFKLVASRRHERQIIASYRHAWPGVEIELVGSSFKFCRIAEGYADLYIRSGNTSIWDTGAGHCILKAAGGDVLTPALKPLIYNPANIINPPFWAFGDQQCLRLNK